MEKRHYANASNHSAINQQPIHQQSLNPLGHLSSPFSINESVPIQSSTPQSANQSSTSQSQSAFERHTALSSSSLYNFSHIESTRSPTLSLDENLYRGIDLSSAVFQIPHQSRASNVPSLDDFDSFQARRKSTEPAQSNLVKKDLSRQPLGMVSSISSYLSSFTSSFTSPSQPEVPRLVLQSAPAFVEQYTSFYSRASADSLVDCIRSYLTFKSIDFEFNHEKAKFCVLFLCPVFTSLSIAFNIRLYSSPKDSNLILCEVQRRDGCSMGFNYVYTSLMNHVKQRQMFSMPFTACPLSSLPNNQPHSVNDVQTLDLPMTLDDQSFNCLVSFVSAGDCVQQSEAVRIIGQCLSSSSGAQMMPRLPALVEVLRSSLTYHPVNSQRSLDEEKAAQITHLVSMLLSSNSRSCSLDPALALRLVPSLTNLLATVVADINLKRLKIVRFILETLNSLTVDHESVNAVKHTFTQRDLEVLRHCSHVKDTEVVRLASVVSQRLATS